MRGRYHVPSTAVRICAMVSVTRLLFVIVLFFMVKTESSDVQCMQYYVPFTSTVDPDVYDD